MANGITPDQAMNECVEAINREAEHYGLEIEASAMEVLRGRFDAQFRFLFAKDPEIWSKIGEDVKKMAGYLGAVAALNADSEQVEPIQLSHLLEAARLIQVKCPAGALRPGEVTSRKAACGGVNLNDRLNE